MNVVSTGRLWLAMGLMAVWHSGATQPIPTPEEATAAIQNRAVSGNVGLQVLRPARGVRVLVDGLSYENVTAWEWKGQDISAALQAAVADGSAVVRSSSVGFEVKWPKPPAAAGVNGVGPLTVRAAQVSGGAVSAAVTPCPASTAFGPATSPVLAADPQCLYGSTTCLQPGKRHTGIDYPGTGNAIAVAAGTVVRVQLMNAADRGMGTNLLVRHILPGPNCQVIYSSYAHLDSLAAAIAVNQPVAKGQVLGVIGGSGRGNPSAFAPHLHLELKSTAVTGNPFGVGDQTQTCGTDPLNSRVDSCWRYVAADAKPDDYGYLDPATLLNRTVSAPVYRTVRGGSGFTCGVGIDNTVACWGYGIAPNPPAGQLKQVAAGNRHACGVTANNTVVCWGANDYGESRPRAGLFEKVSAGGEHSCGIRPGGRVVCWGNNRHGEATPPAGRFLQVSAGFYFSCGLRIDHRLACWGRWTEPDGENDPPSGEFKQVDAPLIGAACALRADDTLACWGKNYDGSHPSGRFREVTSDCALGMDNTIACWGYNFYGGANAPAGRFRQLAGGSEHQCAIAPNNRPVCWGNNAHGEATPSAGRFVQIATGYSYAGDGGGGHSCGVTVGGTLVCWGSRVNGFDGRSTTPAGRFKQVSTEADHTCAIQADDTVACWGANGNGEATPPRGTFKQVTAGGSHSCGIRANGVLACWGSNLYGESQPPRGVFKDVQAGRSHTCAIRTNDTVACWPPGSGATTPPSEPFKQLSSGTFHSCGVRLNNTVACWGTDYNGSTTAPNGRFKQVSAGFTYSCGVRADNSLACWGIDNEASGVITPPTGTFKQVDAGNAFACALRTDGFVSCWGTQVR